MTIHIHRTYTRTGDEGKTGLAGGQRVGKDDPRVEAYGTIDEANAFVGLLREAIETAAPPGGESARSAPAAEEELETIAADLRRIQNDLFDIGSILATPSGANEKRLDPERTRALENRMDEWTESLPPLSSFVLPGGGNRAALAHCARTVVRRAERAVVRLHRTEPVPAEVLKYLNRLSDYLFVLARRLARRDGRDELLWQPPAAP